MSHLSEQLDRIVRQIDAFESQPRRFNAEVFLSDLTNLFNSFELIRTHEERKKELDERLYFHCRRRPLEDSHLRFVTLHLLASSFEIKANALGPYDKAYSFARRDRRDATNEAAFFHTVLLPRLLDPVNLRIPIKVRFALLCRAARLDIEGRMEPLFGNGTSIEEIERLSGPLFALGLVRRWIEHREQNLAKKAGCVENNLFHRRLLERVARFDPVMAEILGPRCLRYLDPAPWYRRLLRAAGIGLMWMWAGVVGVVVGRARGAVYVGLGAACLAAAIALTILAWDRDSERRGRLAAEATHDGRPFGEHGRP